MNVKKIVKGIVEKNREFREFDKLYYKLTSNNPAAHEQFFSLSYFVLESLLSKEDFDIIDWFMWDTEFGEKQMGISFSEGEPLKHYTWEEFDLLLDKLLGEDENEEQ